MNKVALPTAIGVVIASLIIGAFAYINIISRDYEDWRTVKTELILQCMTAPLRTLDTCERYSDWALSQIKPHYLRNCYERYQLRQQALYPSMIVCTAIYKVSFATWAKESPNYCIGGDVC